VMLSAETAVGAYPVEAVRMMDRIARAVEASPEYRDAMHQLVPTADASTADAVALAAVEMAYNLDARLIVTFTSSGNTALRVSRNRPPTPVLAITPNPRALRQMMVAWSVVPYLSDDIHNTDEMVVVAKRGIEATKLIGRDDRFIITAGVPFGMRGTTNLIRVERNR
ncbi:MAG: pyruvate kinase, partial [Trueperaceae bacterium]|nr:pyruvate kinase [Trueperaceae bacterium]